MPPVSRRRFLKDSTAATLAVAAELAPRAEAQGEGFASRWEAWPDRVWLGAEYWANPLQDWRLAGGRVECANAAPERNVHLLTHDLADTSGAARLSVRVGRVGGGPLAGGKGSAGFRIGIRGPLREYRNSLIFGQGLNAGFTAGGGLFIGEPGTAAAGTLPAGVEAVDLRLSVTPKGDRYRVHLAAHDPQSGRQLGEVSRDDLPGPLAGNVALVANYGALGPNGRPRPNAAQAGPEGGRFWFADWRASGSKVAAHPERAFGPILFNHYSLSGGVLKMTAQLPPVGAAESQTVRLQVPKSKEGEWRTVAEERLHPQARTATFRLPRWNAGEAVPYRLAYTLSPRGGRPEEHTWEGTIRRDPVDEPVLTVADVCCNIHSAFPNDGYVARLAKLAPDLLAFTGDQFYESSGGYGVTRAPLDAAVLDYLRKWYLHGWTWRELTRDRPSLSLPDDHDVYQGNLWGEGGAPQETTQEAGGYNMPPDWVNVVHRTQASHHPDPYDPLPCKQGISNWYGAITYGGVRFAILADRQFKTGPDGVVPRAGPRPDHVTDPDFDVKRADVPGAELLGERQLQFLREWATERSGGAMKAVISQTTFTAMATTHGGERLRLRADYDTNGWPQTPRNQAVREIRRAGAVHIAGDQHLPAVVQYGIEAHRDGPYAFAGPPANCGYPRWWEPEQPGRNRLPGAPELTGDFTDHFGHPMTVIAVANGAVQPQGNVLQLLEQKASGFALVRFDKRRRTVTFECWPFLADPTAPGSQFPGWPVTVQVDAVSGGGRAADSPEPRPSPERAT